MSKTVPNFLFPTNFRNGKNIKRLIKDFNVQGYGVAVYLLETLAESDGHKYPLSDVDLLADEMKVSVPVIKTIITSYGLFELIENEEGIIFISSKLNKWLEPYYTKVEKLSRAGKISALKKKKEQEKQLKELSQLDSSQHMLNTCATINKLINKSINKNVDNESEFWREWNETEIKKGMRISKLEDLNLANRDNQVKI
ncbi:DUF4373 domain-containing protein [Aliarcobacter cryaerophilus]|uniref:DUF4373 domain-containing protein n=1 Tax=Aliarcobacter cryaerophilus TaxID=28198 RepID=UPI0021B55CC2|nr:DUF4373 domain-containing protein [Aliarcobacter cryaerophilus]MCT7524894.1 DUF4373 domain-containing protein [Aliarcobacter cryaerophilus]